MTPNPLPYVKDVHDKATLHTPYVMTKLADGQWHQAGELCEGVMGLDDRTVRAIAERSRGCIVSSQVGYRLTQHATLREVRRSADSLRSQARKLLARADEQVYIKSCNRG